MAEPARRARIGTLARRQSAGKGPVREFLAVAMAAELYGLELTRVREILSPPPITLVPRAPSDVVGVCSVRGLLVTVYDLRRKLRLTQAPPTRRSRILLVQCDWNEVIGLFVDEVRQVVDEVRQVVRLAESEIEVASNVLGGDVSESVLGIGRPHGQILVLLDLGSMVKG
jgi:chemotaxis signal transduction protein